ncbi:membrane protein required for colicin V production [Novimethylophilus kurashikiensis]|uniref:Membrane protein required for colicin V production n=1 Tax=Novimethylophilus kurashikiensis TaxID=1825523 RepID=A0A2R5FEE6_9PROT|nr:CvpA family protein [Novimethylophilus kurashikiensis]GBG15123.1 membrane protein required for colicin V production [Novimethylophilus kurashikiensis]
MTEFDYAVLGIIGVSMVLSLMRGFVREFLGLASWVIAAYVAKSYAVDVAVMLPASVSNEGVRLIAAFLIVFFGILLVTSLLAIAIGELFNKVGLGWVDRCLGGLFGCARGVLIACVLVLLGGLTSLPQDPRWRNAMFSAPLEAMVMSAKPWLPPEMVKHLKYD